MVTDWTELGSVHGLHGQLKAYRNPVGGILLVDGAANSIVIPRLSVAALAELLGRAAMPGQDGRRDDGEAAAAGVRDE